MDIERNQAGEKGVEVRRFLASHSGHQSLPVGLLRAPFGEELDLRLYQLVQRELIEQKNGGYQFPVEIIRRWFAERDPNKV